MLLLMPALVLMLMGLADRKLAQILMEMANEGSNKDMEIKQPPQFIPALQIPTANDRAVTTNFMPFSDLPSPSCRKLGNCPVTFLITGTNQSLTQGMADKMFPTVSAKRSSDIASLVLGTEIPLGQNYLSDPAFEPDSPLYYIQNQCSRNPSISLPTSEAMCLEGLHLWRNSSSDINNELFKGSKGNKENMSNEVAAALDFLNTNKGNFNVTLWFKLHADTTDPNKEKDGNALTRLPRLMNLASNAYLQYLQGPGTQMLFQFIKEVPTNISSNTLASTTDAIIPIIYVMMLLYIVPVLLRALVYEKEHNLRLMMKMHGLGDTAYWMVNYVYDFLLSFLYILIFLLAGKYSGLQILTMNDYDVQFVFLFVYINWNISLVFVATTLFSNARSAQVLGTVYQLLMSFLGMNLLTALVEDQVSRRWLILIEIIPGFSLCRGVLDLKRYAKFSRQGAGHGMQWENLSDSSNGMKEVLIIMGLEWLVMLLFAYYVDQVGSAGSGRRKSPLFFLHNFKKNPANFQQPGAQRNTSLDLHQSQLDDVAREREKVEHLIQESNMSHSVICHNIKKIYPARDGNPPKAAVKGLSLALSRTECFGMLGPNGAGKSSFISMMIGLTEPTSGTAYVQGLDITTCMDEVYTCMGVCPQFDLLWGTLTGREHLYFYGRLKNLQGSSLTQAVEESLKAVDLFGVADKEAGKYSGGMKRRLSVAISFIGDPKVVYLDEPSTGLDPASRYYLWNVVKQAKKDRAIILTTHSMEEAEALCDRLGIFVDGELKCVGNSKELKARYGGCFVFTMTTMPDHDIEVEDMVLGLRRNALKVYHLAGTQKFELPKQQVCLADVFQLVENAKSRFPVQAWALADTTLEDVFIKVARAAQDRAANDHHSDTI